MNQFNDIEHLTNAARLGADRLAAQIGVSGAAQRCGVSRPAFTGFIAALPTQRGTVLSIAYGLGLLAVPTPMAVSSLPTPGDVG